MPERTTLQNEAPIAGPPISALQGALDFALSQDSSEVFVSTDLMGSVIKAEAFESGEALSKNKMKSKSKEKIRPKSRNVRES